ncbi:MAG TPA: protein kinase [Thermoanaerobaculia bacterium]|nr:protein kinase [Thermoanaerobaculia bacterium]
MAFYCIHCRSEIAPSYKACPFCGEPITDFLRKYLEVPIDGKYQILSRLGVGGMGEVFKVVHIHLNAVRVVKLMRANVASDPTAHDRFLREARLATRINHPNVATLFDFSTLEADSRYMVWEYIEGINLHELLEQRGPLSARYAAKIAVQALLGLDAIHRAGIVHRDISPENLMITRDNDGEERVKIIDLGIAKQWGDETDEKTKTGMFVGKWKYCSPEHLGMLAEGERIDGRADLYSFGIVLFEMLTGVAPFQAETPHGYLLMHASERPRALREVNPNVTASPEMEFLIRRSLEKDRSKRFPTARNFAQALETLIPSLDEKSGAALPGKATLTQPEEATVRAIEVDPNAPTAVTPLDGDESTVLTESAELEAETVLTAAGPVPVIQRFKVRMTIGAIAATVALVAGTALMLQRDEVPAPVVKKDRPAISQASIIAQPTGRLAIHAFPWANVTSIRDLNSGKSMEIELVTPAPVDLAPGRYEVTLSNPNFRKPITRTVDVAAGRDAMLNVQFTSAESAPLPVFGGQR